MEIFKAFFSSTATIVRMIKRNSPTNAVQIIHLSKTAQRTMFARQIVKPQMTVRKSDGPLYYCTIAAVIPD